MGFLSKLSKSGSSERRTASAGWIRAIWVARLRPFSIVTLVIYGAMSCEPWNYAMAQQAPPVAASALDQALSRFDRSIHGARDLAAELERQTSRGEQELSPNLSALNSRLQEIAAAEPEIQADFDAIGDRLKKAGVPHEILKRHQDAVSDYRANLARLRGDVQASQRLYEDFRQAKGRGRAADADGKYKELKSKVAGLSASLRDKVKDPPHTAIDPGRLPHRRADLPRREPRLSATQFSTLSNAPAPRAGEAQARVLSLGATASLPGPDDLGETPDVRLTPEIRALAAQLGNDPVRIYQYVRSEIAFVPTYGSIQGATACLATHLCNDLDTASLLIALLRAAGVPARYALGTIEVPSARLQNWLGGFTDMRAAVNYVGSSGTPVTGLISDDTPVAARLEHVWVEAFVDYIPSRGTARGPGDTWVPLDASFKQYDYVQGIDLAAATRFDAVSSLRQVAEAATVADQDGAVTNIDMAAIETRATQVRNEIRAYVESHSLDSLQEMVGGRVIQPLKLAAMPASLPYRVLVRGVAVPRVPDTLRHMLRFEVYADQRSFEPGLAWQLSLPELASRKITLSYAPATAADEAALKSYLPAGSNPAPGEFPSSLPGYLVHVKPELRVEGQVVASGGPSTLGQTGTFRMVFTQPGEGPRTVDNVVTAGTYSAVVLNLGSARGASARQARTQTVNDRIHAGDTAGLTKDDVLGELLYGAGALYWSELELFGRTTAEVEDIVTSRLPSEGIFTYDLRVSLMFGVPRLVSAGSMTTDVDTDIQAVVARDGHATRPVDYMAVTGSMASRSESAVWDQLMNETPTGAGINAISYIEAAARQNIPIYHIDSTNLAAALPKLQVSTDVKIDIQDAVAAGRVVTIPQRPFAKDGFQGVGYIVFDPSTGAAGYMISGGLAGGGFQLPSINPLLNFMLGCILVGIGVFTTGGVALIFGVLGIALILYDLLTTVQNLDSNLSADAQDMIIGFLVTLAIVGILLTGIGVLFGSLLGFVIFALYWAFLSIMASNILISIASLLSRRDVPLTSRAAALWRLWHTWMREWIGSPWVSAGA